MFISFPHGRPETHFCSMYGAQMKSTRGTSMAHTLPMGLLCWDNCYVCSQLFGQLNKRQHFSVQMLSYHSMHLTSSFFFIFFLGVAKLDITISINLQPLCHHFFFFFKDDRGSDLGHYVLSIGGRLVS